MDHVRSHTLPADEQMDKTARIDRPVNFLGTCKNTLVIKKRLHGGVYR